MNNNKVATLKREQEEIRILINSEDLDCSLDDLGKYYNRLEEIETELTLLLVLG